MGKRGIQFIGIFTNCLLIDAHNIVRNIIDRRRKIICDRRIICDRGIQIVVLIGYFRSFRKHLQMGLKIFKHFIRTGQFGRLCFIEVIHCRVAHIQVDILIDQIFQKHPAVIQQFLDTVLTACLITCKRSVVFRTAVFIVCGSAFKRAAAAQLFQFFFRLAVRRNIGIDHNIPVAVLVLFLLFVTESFEFIDPFIEDHDQHTVTGFGCEFIDCLFRHIQLIIPQEESFLRLAAGDLQGLVNVSRDSGKHGEVIFHIFRCVEYKLRKVRRQIINNAGCRVKITFKQRHRIQFPIGLQIPFIGFIDQLLIFIEILRVDLMEFLKRFIGTLHFCLKGFPGCITDGEFRFVYGKRGIVLHRVMHVHIVAFHSADKLILAELFKLFGIFFFRIYRSRQYRSPYCARRHCGSYCSQKSHKLPLLSHRSHYIKKTAPERGG